MKIKRSSQHKPGIPLRSSLRPGLAAWFTLAAIFLCVSLESAAQTHAYSTPVADQIVQQQGTDSFHGTPSGSLLEGMRGAWYNSADGRYFAYEKKVVDAWLQRGSTQNAVSSQDDWNAGLLGSELLLMYEVTRDQIYYDATTSLHSRLASACNSNTVEPCRAEPFLAAYAVAFQHGSELPAIAGEFQHWQGLLQARMHRKDNTAGASLALMRARLLAALADTLPSFSRDSVDEQRLLKIFRAESESSHEAAFESGSKTARDGEQVDLISARLLRVYALLKGVRLGYLSPNAASHIASEWKSLIAQPLHPDADNGALLLAATEMDLKQSAQLGHEQTALLDAWFNSQQRRNAAGQTESFHYKWQDYSDSGYSLLGHIFRGDGVNTGTLYSAPTQENLSKAQYYIIVSPDNPAKNPNPHYMTEQDANAVAAWVRSGGVLVMFENDPPNADIAHLDLLADTFGIHFDDVLHHHILNDKARGDHIEDGTIAVAGGGPIFHDSHKLYMKDTCAISLSGTAQAMLKDRGDVVMAMARYGKGMVFAAVDPWAYNEYTDGRKKAAIYGQFDNFAAAAELVRWLVEQHNALAAPAKIAVK